MRPRKASASRSTRTRRKQKAFSRHLQKEARSPYLYSRRFGLKLSLSSQTVLAFRGSSTAANVQIRTESVFMKRVSLVMCLALLAASCSRQADDERAIREQVVNYTRALDAGDLNLAGRVWSTTKDVSAITPMGHSHGCRDPRVPAVP